MYFHGSTIVRYLKVRHRKMSCLSLTIDDVLHKIHRMLGVNGSIFSFLDIVFLLVVILCISICIFALISVCVTRVIHSLLWKENQPHFYLFHHNATKNKEIQHNNSWFKKTINKINTI